MQRNYAFIKNKKKIAMHLENYTQIKFYFHGQCNIKKFNYKRMIKIVTKISEVI